MPFININIVSFGKSAKYSTNSSYLLQYGFETKSAYSL